MWSQGIEGIRQTAEGDISLYDFIQTITRSKNPRTEWARLRSHAPGTCARIPLVYVQFPGSGEHVTPCTNTAGAHVLGLLLMAQTLDRAERSLVRTLKTLDKVKDAAVIATFTAVLGTARALRMPGRGATHTTP